MEIEALLHNNPESVELFLVYADTLQQEGHPLGDLMALHYSLSQATDHKRLIALRKEYEALLAKTPALLNPLLRQDLDLDLLFGLVRRAWIYRKSSETKLGTASAQLRTLLNAPCARFLTDLHLELANENQPNPFSVFEEAPELRSLRRLRLNDQRHGQYRQGERLDPALAHATGLRSLQLRGHCPALTELKSESIEYLEIATNTIPLELLATFQNANLPRLKTLILHLTPPRSDTNAYREAVIALLTALKAPQLRHLGFHQTPYTNIICQRLHQGELLRQLEVLDLSAGSLTDEGAMTILAESRHFRHLKRLNLSENWINQTASRLEGLGAFVTLGTQRVFSVSNQGQPSS
jgi:hypothetical protein